MKELAFMIKHMPVIVNRQLEVGSISPEEAQANLRMALMQEMNTDGDESMTQDPEEKPKNEEADADASKKAA